MPIVIRLIIIYVLYCIVGLSCGFLSVVAPANWWNIVYVIHLIVGGVIGFYSMKSILKTFC